jgi:hypothetical protein
MLNAAADVDVIQNTAQKAINCDAPTVARPENYPFVQLDRTINKPSIGFIDESG